MKIACKDRKGGMIHTEIGLRVSVLVTIRESFNAKGSRQREHPSHSRYESPNSHTNCAIAAPSSPNMFVQRRLTFGSTRDLYLQHSRSYSVNELEVDGNVASTFA